ncbi:hypothetical protein F8M41_010173 [Gigaspora margarita]|uniref:Uncharacterized protein n=1 Tax=Gigaspora margarita TaxID=4874 RepID=A0A8H4AUI1_GIGMA|nr:hypothetical protein F8M41_010173 [Gigaspora margarita]
MDQSISYVHYYNEEIYENEIIDLMKLIDIERNNELALRYRAEAYYIIEKYKETLYDMNKLLKIDINNE